MSCSSNRMKKLIVFAAVMLGAFGMASARNAKVSREAKAKFEKLQWELNEYVMLQNAYFEELGEFGNFRGIGYKPIYIGGGYFDIGPVVRYDIPDVTDLSSAERTEVPGISMRSLFQAGDCFAFNFWELEPMKSESGGIVWKFTEPDEPACKGLVKFKAPKPSKR